MTRPIRMCRDYKCALCSAVAWLVLLAWGSSADALRTPQLATDAEVASSIAPQTSDRAKAMHLSQGPGMKDSPRLLTRPSCSMVKKRNHRNNLRTRNQK